MASTRREFMGTVVASAGAAALGQLVPGSVLAGTPSQRTGRVLVIVQQSGGNDGLNTVVPFEDDAYHRVRPTLRIDKKSALRLSGTIGLHPRMTALKALFDAGELAVIQGAGYPRPNRSHFRSMEIWHTANPTDVLERDGWLGRVLAARQKPGETAPGVFIGTELPLALVMPRGQVTVLPNVASFRPLPDPRAGGDQGVRLAALGEVQSAKRPRGASATLAFLEDASRSALKASQRIQEMARSYTTPVSYAGGLGQSLRLVATLISGGADFEVYYVSQGGYDTHANQFGAQANLLGELSAGMAAFHTDMKRLGRARDVAVVTFSEFGRRVAENASRGTDHGTAGPMFVLGGAVKGGLLGEYPSLSSLDQGDLRFTTDFRRVYAALLGKWMGVDPSVAMRGRFEPLPLFG